MPTTEAGGDEEFIEGTEGVNHAAGGERAGAGGDDADEAFGFVPGDRTAVIALANAEARRALGADEIVLERIGSEGAGTAGRAKRFGRDAVEGPATEIENIEAELEAAAHEAGALGEGVAAAFEFEAHHEVARLHDFGEQEAGAEGVRDAAGDDEGIAYLDRDAVEAGFEAGDVLGFDEPAKLVARRRALESKIQIRRVREIVADGEDVVGLGFAGGGVEEFLGERGGRVSLEVEADRRVEELDEELGDGAVAGGVRGAEVVGGVGGEEIGEVVRRRVVTEVDGRNTFGEPTGASAVAGGVGGIDRAGGRGDPVFGEMGVGGGEGGHGDVPAHRGGSEAIKLAAAEIGAPDAVRREPKKLRSEARHDQNDRS